MFILKSEGILEMDGLKCSDEGKMKRIIRLCIFLHRDLIYLQNVVILYFIEIGKRISSSHIKSKYYMKYRNKYRKVAILFQIRK